MSMHTEWDTARDCEIAIERGADVEADEEVTSDYVLFLGGSGGGCLAVEGTAAELKTFALRIARTVGLEVEDR